MEHKRRAFKVNSVRVVRAVKETALAGTLAALVRGPNDQNSCKKFSQIATFAQKIDGLPSKHTFFQSKK
jgi:hypothetical protein